MSRASELGIDLSAYYAADDAYFARGSSAPGVVRVEDIVAPESVRKALAAAPSVRYGRCPKCGEQTSSAEPCCGIDPWEDGE